MFRGTLGMIIMLHLEYVIWVCIFQMLCEAEFPAFYRKSAP